MAKVKAKTRAKVKRTSPVALKAGSTTPKNVGGVVNIKVVAIANRNNG